MVPHPTTHAAAAEVRRALFRLHRALLEHERRQYERAFGRVNGNGAFLQLVLHDPWFAWLRPLSGLLARMDERLDAEEPLAAAEAAAFADEVRAFVAQRRYAGVLQESPELVVMHSGLVKILDAA